MCWNAEISLQTFITTTIVLLILFSIGYNKSVIILIFSFVFIQLVEFFMWTYIDKPHINKYFGIISYIIIFMQPIILMYFSKYSTYIKYYILLHILVFIVCVLFFDLKLSSFDFVPKVAKNKHLIWDWVHNNAYIIGFFMLYTPFFMLTIYAIHKIAFVVALITLIYSTYNYYEYSTISTMWCWIANICVILTVIHVIFRPLFLKLPNFII